MLGRAAPLLALPLLSNLIVHRQQQVAHSMTGALRHHTTSLYHCADHPPLYTIVLLTATPPDSNPILQKQHLTAAPPYSAECTPTPVVIKLTSQRHHFPSLHYPPPPLSLCWLQLLSPLFPREAADMKLGVEAFSQL